MHFVLFFYFQIFYWSHLLYILYWGILIIHAPNFWKWFIVPAVVFAIEKIGRIAKSLSNEGKSWVPTGVVLPSKAGFIFVQHFRGF